MAGVRGDKKFWAGIIISIFFTALLVRKIDPAKVVEAFRSMDWRYLVPAVASTFLSYYLRAIRWRLLLTPLKTCAMVNVYPATIIGYMANNILPARLGEIVRAFLLADREGLRKGTTLATLVLDRVLDGFSVLVIIVVTLFLLRLPPGMEHVGQAFRTGGSSITFFYLLVLAFLAFLKYRTGSALKLLALLVRPLPKALSDKVLGAIESFVAGIALPSGWKMWVALLAVSAGIWLAALWPIDLVLRSFDIHLPFTASLFIMVFLVLAVMVPASPGYLGTYHAACTYGLMAFGIEKEKALGMAIVIHALGFFPVTAAGFYYLWRLKLSLGKIQEESAEGEE